VYGDPDELLEDAEVGQRGPSSGVVEMVGGQGVSGGHVQPPAGAGDFGAGLVDVQDVCRGEQGADHVLDLDEGRGGGAQYLAHPARRGPRAPDRSVTSSTTRATGTCWKTSRYTTHARRLGP
jgi:hypothetical protein